MQNGYGILDKNYSVLNLGEIDIVCLKDKRIVFIEVKTRNVRHETIFPIGFSINRNKRRNLKRICQIYLMKKNHPYDQEWQVDALFINIDPETNEKNIDHFENILWESYY